MQSIIFLIQCPDQRGLVARISGFFYQRGFNIVHCQQYTDSTTNQFYMRLKLDLATLATARAQLEDDFAAFAQTLALEWRVRYTDVRQRVAILVTKTAHCLYDLLLRQQEGELVCDVPAVIGNHPTLEPVARQFKIPFHCLPPNAHGKPAQETQLCALLHQYQIDVVALARYMQVLSPEFVQAFAGRIINIHHAFLPAFQGGNPYQRAYEQGVKMIGATAHYATADLDEGPIIDQDVERVSHEDAVEDLQQIGKDIERVVLARALKAHLEHRVIVSGRRTIVFSTGV